MPENINDKESATANRTYLILNPIDEAEAQAYRDLFPIFENTRYLNSCSLGPLSRRSRQGLVDYADAWSEFGAPAWWLRWMPQIERIRELYARVISAERHSVTIQHSISSALGAVASAFDYESRPRVVIAEIDFPTIAYQWLARRDVEVVFARSADGVTIPLEEYERLIDERTALVATSHVFYATGAAQDVAAIGKMAHAHGAAMLVDGYHAVGATPVDVPSLGVDFYLGGTLKWLCGGPGLTFIYSADRADISPQSTGWFAAENQFTFDTTNFEAAGDANRFQFGTPAMATVYTGIPSLELMLDVGFDRICDRVRGLTSRAIKMAQELGLIVATPVDEAQRAGIVMLRVAEPEAAVQSLSEQGITIDARPGKIRISPHYFNIVSDIERVMDVLSRDAGESLATSKG